MEVVRRISLAVVLVAIVAGVAQAGDTSPHPSVGLGSIRARLPVGTTNVYTNASGSGCGGGGCSDLNDGLTQATAKKTVLGMLYSILAEYDFQCSAASQSTVQINMLANEINAGNSLHFGPHDFVGACAGGSIILDGGGFTYEYDSASAAAIDVFFSSTFQIQHINLANSLGVCLQLDEHASVRASTSFQTGNCGIGIQLFGDTVFSFLTNPTFALNTTQTAWINADQNSVVNFPAGLTITCTGTPVVTWVLVAQDGAIINLGTPTWSGCGSLSGQQYALLNGGKIYGGAANIPGSGHTSTGLGMADGHSGTNQADNAQAGDIGEIITAQVLVGAQVNLATATPANIASVSLTPGDWDVTGVVSYNPAGTTTIASLICWTGTASATFPTRPNSGGMMELTLTFTTGNPQSLPCGTQRFSFNSTTTVFLESYQVFGTSTLGGYGYLRARRVR